MTELPVRIYAGAHQSEALALKVLEHSIKRHTTLPVEIQTIDNSLAPPVKDPRFLPYTNFSYGRFAIPKLAGYRGRAVYLDSDMIVFRDIEELWNTPFDGAKVLVEEITPETRGKGRLTAVMLLNCAELDWDLEQIVPRLGVDFDMNELMSVYPLVGEGELQDKLPLGWNSLDEFTEHTRLLHYTKIKTQPWVYPAHELGYLWIDEVKMMLENGTLTPEFVREEVEKGHVRPSLLPELGLSDEFGGRTPTPRELLKYDKRAGYVIHEKLIGWMHERKMANLALKENAEPVGFARWKRRTLLRNFLRHPVKFIRDPRKRL